MKIEMFAGGHTTVDGQVQSVAKLKNIWALGENKHCPNIQTECANCGLWAALRTFKNQFGILPWETEPAPATPIAENVERASEPAPILVGQDGLPFIRAIEILRLEPGDVAVLKFPVQTSNTMNEKLMERWRSVFPNNKLLILGGADLMVMRPEEVKDPDLTPPNEILDGWIEDAEILVFQDRQRLSSAETGDATAAEIFDKLLKHDVIDDLVSIASIEARLKARAERRQASAAK